MTEIVNIASGTLLVAIALVAACAFGGVVLDLIDPVASKDD